VGFHDPAGGTRGSPSGRGNQELSRPNTASQVPHTSALSSTEPPQFGQRDMTSNDRVERPTTLLVPRPDAAHAVSRSARTHC
jgi:hypothetical protein